MAMTIEQLRALVEAEGLNYFIHPKLPALMLGLEGLFGSYRVALQLDLDGQFLQFRSVGYLRCPTDHPNLGAVLQAACHINYMRRLLKIGWDPEDGEIVVYADAWPEDGAMTQAQFSRYCSMYFPGIDFAYDRLKKTLDAGQDPGDPDVEKLVSGTGLPERLRKLLERLKGRKKEGSSGSGVDEI